MKHLNLLSKTRWLLVMLMSITLGVGNARAYEITFKENGASDGTQAKTSKADIIATGDSYVTSISNATRVYQGKTGFGIKIGTSSTGNLTINFSESGQIKPTKIIVKACRWEGANGFDSGNLSYKINGASSASTVTLTNTLEDHEISMDGNTTLQSLYLASTSKRIYIKSITVSAGITKTTLFLNYPFWCPQP